MKKFLTLKLVFLSVISLQAGIQLDQNQYDLVVVPGFDHTPLAVPYTLETPTFDDSVITVSSDEPWAIPSVQNGSKQIEVAFDTKGLITTRTATLTINDGEKTLEVFLYANLSPLDVYRLVDDPVRSKVYGIHRDGIDVGAVFAWDPINEVQMGCVTVGDGPTDFVIQPDGSELLVINSVSKDIQAIDLSSLTVSETIDLPVYGAWGDTDDTTANIELGPGDIIYYVDGMWGPVLHTLDRSSGTVLQSMIFNGSSPTNSTGFMDIAITSDRTKMFALPQYGWSAGGHSSIAGHYTIAPDGMVSFVKSTTISGIDREPFEAPALITADDEVAIMKTIAVDPADTSNLLRTFPSTIWSMSPGGEIVATMDKIYDYESGLALLDIPLGSTSRPGYLFRQPQVFTSDYARFIYFDHSDKTLKTINLIETIGLDALGRTLSPGDGAVVTSPDKLVWSPVISIDEFDVYLGTSETDVGSADTGSPIYLGRVSGTEFTLSSSLAPGTTYYWRVDPVGVAGPSKGDVFSFTVAEMALSKPEIDATTVVVHRNFTEPIDLNAPNPTNWTVAAADSWISFVANSGTTPSTLEVVLDAGQLTPGIHRSSLTITSNGQDIVVPVRFDIEPLSLTHIKSTPASSLVYAISEDTNQTPSRAYLLEIDAGTESVLRVSRVGQSVTDLAIDLLEDKIYVPNWRPGTLLELDRTSMTVSTSHSFSPIGSGSYGGDVYNVAVGAGGRLLIEEEDQWIDILLYDPKNQADLDRAFVREGGGAFDPTGRFYYHGENNSSGAALLKYDMLGDVLTSLGEVRPSGIPFYYGARKVVVSQNGNRIFWAGVVFDPNLDTEWINGDIVYSASPDGRYAFGDEDIFDISLREVAFKMPVTTTVSGFNSTESKLIVQEDGVLAFYDFSNPGNMAAPQLSATPLSDTAITVSWTDESLELNFQLQQRLKGTTSWADVDTLDANVIELEVGGLTQETTYEYRVRARTSRFSSSWSNVGEATTFGAPPAAPSLSQPVASFDAVQISWSTSALADRYVLERRESPSSVWEELATIPTPTTHYVDDEVTSGVTYSYRLRAFNGSLPSGYSSARSVTTPQPQPPATPAFYRVSVINSGELELEWSDVASEDGYRIERSEDGPGNWVELVDLPEDSTTYSDTTVMEGVVYHYRVIAFNWVGDSQPSSPLSATPANLVMLLEDRFDPVLNQAVWESISGASLEGGSVGFGSGNALWFGASGLRQATTIASDLSGADSLSFSVRAGNQNVDGSTYWNNSEAGESVVVEYSNDGSNWFSLQTLDTVYPNLSSWQTVTILLPTAARVDGAQLRWRQLKHSGSGYDTWALDNISLVGYPPEPPETPPFLLASANSSKGISLFWGGVEDAQSYLVFRRSFFGAWELVGQAPSPDTYYVDQGLRPSTLYQYAIRAVNPGGESESSYTVLAKTWSHLEQWTMERFGTNELSDVGSEEEQAQMLLRYSFNLEPAESLISLDADDIKGTPTATIDPTRKQLQLRFLRRTPGEASGVDYIVEFTCDLKTWEESGVITTIESRDDDWEVVTIEDTNPSGAAGCRFGRVRVERK